MFLSAKVVAGCDGKSTRVGVNAKPKFSFQLCYYYPQFSSVLYNGDNSATHVGLWYRSYAIL